MIIRKCHQPTRTYDANCYLSAGIEVVTRYVLLLLLINLGVFSANAQMQQEQIVFVSEGADLEQIRLRKVGGGQVTTNNLTLQAPEGSYSTPSLSFDGERVAFVWPIDRNREWHFDIYIMDIRS